MALTVRQVGQLSAPLRQKIEQFQLGIDNNDQTIARIREQIKQMEPRREALSLAVQRRQDDQRNLYSALARLEDGLASFSKECTELENVIEELPRMYQSISLPDQLQGAAAASGMQAPPGGAITQLIPTAAIDLPLPFFEKLAFTLQDRAQRIWERVNDVERALMAYSSPATGVPAASQIETIVRSQHAQFRSLANQIARIADRVEQIREAAIRTRGVPAGMLARPSDIPIALYGNQLNSLSFGNQYGPGFGNHLLGPVGGGYMALGMLGQPGGMMGQPGGMMGQPGGMLGQSLGGGLFGANTGGGMFGASTGGGLFGQSSGGGLFGANTGGGLFGQNTGGGLFGQNTGGGLFGQNTGGGLFGQSTGGGLFGQSSGGGLFGQNTGGGMFGQSSGGGLFGANTGGGLFGAKPSSGGGLFGQNTGGGMFGQPSGGGLFGQNTGGGMFGQPSGGGGLFGQNTGGGMFGQPSSGGGLFGQNTGGGMFGQPSGGGGLFGQNTGGGMFGQPSGGGGMFGQPSSGGGLFGQPNTGGGLFGANTGGGLFG